MITLGKRGDLHARRQASQVIRTREVLAKLFDQVGPRFKDRPGGYTRIIKLGNRLGDNAPQSIIELVEEEFTAKPKKAAPAPKVEVKKAAPAPAAAPVEEAAAEVPAEEKPEA
jgi:large subunit ribosomal protein L17